MVTCMLREQMAALPPSIALQQFAKHVNESATQSAIDVRSVLSQVEGLARSAFHDKAALVRHFSSNSTSVSVATLQVQLCEYNQFRKWCSRQQWGVCGR